MSKTMTVVVPHQLSRAEARGRVNYGLTQFQTTFGKGASLDQANWTGDELAWTVRVVGVAVTGTTTVGDDSVTVQTTLPAVYAPFAARGEELIQKYGTMLLAGPSKGEPEPARPPRKFRMQLRRKAKAAAEAAGRPWSELSKEERHSFVSQARQEVQAEAPAPSGQ
jgi:hypothetical protein